MDEWVKVAYQGEAGAFSDEAISACFGAAVTAVACPEFSGIAHALLQCDVDYGMLPVENSIAGGVAPAYDMLARAEMTITAEVVLPIRLCLLGVTGASLEGVRRVQSHPVALAQCQRFLSTLPGVEAIAVHDTAGAARFAAERGDPALAAVAGRGAAERYGLVVLAADIQDRSDNQTRFYVVARPDSAVPKLLGSAGPRRTALLLDTAHRAGALVDALVPLAEAGVNLTRIESRPGDEPWHYRFFLELDADAEDRTVTDAIRAAAQRSHHLHVLGSFRRYSLVDQAMPDLQARRAGVM